MGGDLAQEVVLQFVSAAVAVVKGKAAGQECGEQQGGTERGGQAQLDGVAEGDGDGEVHGVSVGCGLQLGFSGEAMLTEAVAGWSGWRFIL